MGTPQVGQRYPMLPRGKLPGGTLLRKSRLRKKRRKFNIEREARIRMWMNIDIDKLTPVDLQKGVKVFFEW